MEACVFCVCGFRCIGNKNSFFVFLLCFFALPLCVSCGRVAFVCVSSVWHDVFLDVTSTFSIIDEQSYAGMLHLGVLAPCGVTYFWMLPPPSASLMNSLNRDNGEICLHCVWFNAHVCIQKYKKNRLHLFIFCQLVQSHFQECGQKWGIKTFYFVTQIF